MHIKTINMYCWLDRAELNSIWVFYRCSRERACRSGVTVLPPEITPLRHTTPRTLHHALLRHLYSPKHNRQHPRASATLLPGVSSRQKPSPISTILQSAPNLYLLCANEKREITDSICMYLGCWTWIVQQLGHCLSL